MGGRDDAHVDRVFLGVADAPHLLLLDHAQQLHLHRQRQVAHLVEEERAVLGCLEVADLVAVRARERTFLVAEEFALHQVLGNRAAVDRDERGVRPRGTVVDEARGHFLAAAGFAGDVDRSLGARQLGDHVACARDCRRFPQQARGAGDGGLADGRAARLRGLGQLERAHHQRAQLLQLDRLGEIVEGARLERLHRVLGRAIGGDHRHGRVAVVLGDVAQHLEAVAIGQPHVGEAQVVRSRAERLLRLRDRGHGVGVHSHAREREHQQLPDVGFVVHDEHGLAVHYAPFKVTRKCPPAGLSMYSMRAPLPSQSSRAM